MKYRKKPVVIEAIQLADGLDWAVVKAFCPTAEFFTDAIIIPTMEGRMRANPNDWIIKGIKGEFYPCKDEIFRATYEREDGSAV